MSSVPDHAAIYKKLHENREEHIEQARRARDMQAELAKLQQELEKADDEIRSLKAEVYDDWL